MGEESFAPEDAMLLEDVRKRVRLWKEIASYYNYGSHKPAESRGTEAVLNAFVLASADAVKGRPSPDTLSAFADMWNLQETAGRGRGAWNSIQFDNEPFEGHDSEYYGAALAGVATGIAPEGYGENPKIQKNISLLRGYLNREYRSQSLINRVTALWASVELPGLFTKQRQQNVIRDVLEYQRAAGAQRKHAARIVARLFAQ